MTTNYAQHVSRKVTPQSEPIPDTNQEKNNAGGYSYVIDCWGQLDRFLILGCAGGTYYCSERAMTKDNAACVLECLKQNPQRTVDRIVEISTSGRAPKQDPALFALALCSRNPLALQAIPKVCRTGTHLMQFVNYIESAKLRGWGRGLCRGVQSWYQNKSPRDLSYQLVKYQNRESWSHRDLLRLSHLHPKAISESSCMALYWALKGWEGVGEDPHPDENLLPIWAFEKAKKATTAAEIIKLIQDYRLVRECIPTQFLNDPGVWEALLQDMPMEAMVRNLGKMTSCGLVKSFSEAAKLIRERLGDPERIRKARLHPLKLLVALNIYTQGKGDKGSLSWSPVSEVSTALEQAVYLSFKTVEPTNQRHLLALDVSGSMSCGTIAGMSGITPAVGSAVLAMVNATIEPRNEIFGFGTTFHRLAIQAGQSLASVCRYMNNLNFGGTDCSLPMLHAAKEKLEVDVFQVYTDSETWAGKMHPRQALQQYREKMGIPAKLVVVGMTATKFSIADPKDAGMLDVVGFDTHVPEIIRNFVIS